MADAKKEDKTIGIGIGLFIFSLVVTIILTVIAAVPAFQAIISAPQTTAFAKMVMLPLFLLYTMGLIGFSAYSIISLYQFRKNAVRIAQATIFLLLLDGLVTAYMGYLIEGAGGILYAVIWGIYITKSKTVKRRYPSDQRKLPNMEKMLVIAVAASIVSMVFANSLLAGAGQVITEESTFEECVAAYGEETCLEDEYALCMEYFDDFDNCYSYWECLEIERDYDLCFNQFFEYEE